MTALTDPIPSGLSIAIPIWAELNSLSFEAKQDKRDELNEGSHPYARKRDFFGLSEGICVC